MEAGKQFPGFASRFSFRQRFEVDIGISVNEAGRRGGLSILRKRGRSFFAEIGRKGQAAMRQKYPNMASQWGKRGGRPRKPNLNEMGEEALDSKKGGCEPAH